MRFIRSFFTLIFSLGLLFPTARLNAQDCFELVWSEEFNYTGLPDSSIWSYETGGGGWGNNELQYYTQNRPENARVGDGHLVIEARKEAYESNSYTSARLITYHKGHSFRYGKIEARIKLPYGQGIWPAFWMLGDGIFEGTPWPACGEIDIMEMVGGGEGRDDVVHGTLHWTDANGNHAIYGGDTRLAEGVFADDFHLFSIEWDATEIRWFLDGAQYHSINITPGHLSKFHESFFILLNIAVGGNWPGSPDASTVFPQKMYVDYVRVYQKDTFPGIIGDTVVVAAAKQISFSTAESEDFTYSWSVPAGAEITGGQGTHSIQVDWGCDTGTVSCSLAGNCGQYDLGHKVKLKDLEISGKDRVEINEAELIYRVPPTMDATHHWTLPAGVVLNTKNDTSSIELDWNDSDGEILLVLTNSCGADTASLQISAISQLPYPDPGQPHLIPGTIESVHFDTGGEGIAYHDFEPENLGNGSRQDEGVDTEPNDGGENIGWLEWGEWLEYTIRVEKTAFYDLDIRAGSINSAGRFEIFFDGENRTGDIVVPLTGSWTAFTTISLKDLQLSEGDSIMRIRIVNGQFNLGRLTFREATANLVNSYESDPVLIYPTLTDRFIYVKNLGSAHRFHICDLMGRKITSGIIEPEMPVNVGKLCPGAYYLFLEGDRTSGFAGKFLKTD